MDLANIFENINDGCSFFIIIMKSININQTDLLEAFQNGVLNQRGSNIYNKNQLVLQMTDSASKELINIQIANLSLQMLDHSVPNKNITGKKKNHKKKLKKKQNKSQESNKIKSMLMNAQKVIESNEIHFLPSLSNNSLGAIRKKYCNQILKCLLFGYQELSEQVEIRRINDQQWMTCRETQFFLSTYPDLQSSVLVLFEIAADIQLEMYQLHRIRFGQQQQQPRKYKFQMTHFLRNLKDIYNTRFRQEIIVGILPSKSVASMDELQMLQPNKRQFILTKNKSLLYSREQTKRHRKTIEKKEDQFKSSQIIINCREQQQTAINEDNTSEKKLSFYFSKGFIDKLEAQIMEIPDKTIRKRILFNLKTELTE